MAAKVETMTDRAASMAHDTTDRAAEMAHGTVDRVADVAEDAERQVRKAAARKMKRRGRCKTTCSKRSTTSSEEWTPT